MKHSKLKGPGSEQRPSSSPKKLNRGPAPPSGKGGAVQNANWRGYGDCRPHSGDNKPGATRSGK